MKTTVKIAGLAVPLVLSTVAGAAGNSYAPSNASVQVVTAAAQSTPSYIQASFSFGLSRGVGLAYTDDTSGVYANAGNQKGNLSFGAATTGGGVTACTAKSANTATGYALAAPATGSNGCT